MTRAIPATPQIADQALRLLFAGPNASEKKLELTNSFQPVVFFRKGTKPLAQYYLGVNIKNGVAIVNFKPGATEYLGAPLCTQTRVKGPIEQTLKQFTGIKEIEYAIDGQVVDGWDA